MIFDWSISLGNILTIAGFAFSGVLFVMMMRADLMVLAHRVGNLEGAFKQLTAATIAIAKEETRVLNVEERLTLISRRLDDHIADTK